MSELLGFAVLTSPLWLIVVLFVAAVWIALKVSARYRSGFAKIVVGLGMITLVVGLPFLDGFAGRSYFRYLCATKAGPKVYQTVELPATFWDEAGNPKFLKPNGALDTSILDSRFRKVTLKTPYASLLAIDEHRRQVVDSARQQTLGEVVTYFHWGGWIFRSLNPAGPSAVDCEGIRGPKMWYEFHSSLFTRATRK